MSFKRSGWVAPEASFVVFCALSAACMTQSPSSSDERNSPQKQAISAPRNAQAPESEAVLIRSAAEGYEIEVQSPKGFAARAFDPVLRIGEQEFQRYRESETVGIYGIVYTLSAEQFQGLPEGGSVSVGYGPNPNAAKSFGDLNKGALSVVK